MTRAYDHWKCYPDDEQVRCECNPDEDERGDDTCHRCHGDGWLSEREAARQAKADRLMESCELDDVWLF